MIDYDASDAVADLRDFSFNCRRLLQLEREIRLTRQEIDASSMRSGMASANHDKSHYYKEDNHDKLFDMIEGLERKQQEYAALRKQIRLMSRVLASMQLDEKQIRLLSLYCEANATFITIGRIMRCSPVTAWEALNDIKQQFADEYIRILETSARAPQGRSVMAHPERLPKPVLDALDIA